MRDRGDIRIHFSLSEPSGTVLMAEANDNNPIDDLDAFFSAASSANPLDLQQAAQSVTGTSSGRQWMTSDSEEEDVGEPQPDDVDVRGNDGRHDYDVEELEGKFIAIDPASVPGGEDGGDPFILIPANIPALLPWWAWIAIGLGLLVMVAAVVLMPGLTLHRLASRLDDANPANAQYVMRQLVIRGDERTVGTLYDLASSRDAKLATRLRAVDTLGLMHLPHADRALLRLELASDTHEQIREAAIAARKQREAAKTRGIW